MSPITSLQLIGSGRRGTAGADGDERKENGKQMLGFNHEVSVPKMVAAGDLLPGHARLQLSAASRGVIKRPVTRRQSPIENHHRNACMTPDSEKLHLKACSQGDLTYSIPKPAILCSRLCSGASRGLLWVWLSPLSLRTSRGHPGRASDAAP